MKAATVLIDGRTGRWRYRIDEPGMRRTGWLDAPANATDDELRSAIRHWEFGFAGEIERAPTPEK